MRLNWTEIADSRQPVGSCRVSLWSVLALGICVALFPDGRVIAQESGNRSDTVSIEEIVVTARMREERLQELPMSVTALSGQRIEELNLQDISDAADYAPNVTFIEGGNGVSGAIVYIRGIGDAGVEDPNFAPGVAVYVDDVYLPRSWGGIRELFDLERMEILRGPQGTLSGRNTVGGAVHMVSRKPGSEFAGRAQLSLGNHDYVHAKLSMDIPLTDTLYTSVSAFSKTRDGYTRSLYTGDEQHDLDRKGIRVAARWVPNDDLTVDLSADYVDADEAGEGRGIHFVYPGTLTHVYNSALVWAGRPTWEESITDSLWTNNAAEPQLNKFEDKGVRLGIDWDFGPAVLTSISAYRELPNEQAHDHEGQITDFWHQDDKFRDHQQFSQELRFSGLAFGNRLDWVVGGYYYTDETTLSHHQVLFGELFGILESMPFASIAPAPGLPLNLCFAPGAYPCFGGAGNPANFGFFFRQNDINRSETEAESWAGFVHGTFALTERLSIEAGVRYTDEEKTDEQLHNLDWTTGEVIQPEDCPIRPADCAVGRRTDSWNAWTPRFGIDFQVTDVSLLYLTISKGFKAGGFNNILPADQVPFPQFDEEEVWAYELGYKSEWWDNRLRLNTAVFFNDYTDLQLSGAFFDPQTGPRSFRTNAASAEIWGAEVEFEVQPTDRLNISGFVAYLDEDFTDLKEGVADVTAGTEIPYTPDWNANLQARYEFPLGGFGTLTVMGSAVYTDKQYMGLSNLEEVAEDSYTLYNGRITLAPNSGRWEVSIWGNNLSDEEVITYAFGGVDFGNVAASGGPPRMYGGTLTFNF